MQINTDKSTAEGECTDDVWPIGKKAAFYSLFIVMVLAVLDGLDRQIVAALLPYIKVEFALSDTQLGLIVSIVNFAIAAFVIPTAYLVDNWSRKKSMSLMCGVWSVATALCALSTNFYHLLFARFMVGAGEAGYNPAAQALLAAQFPNKFRSTVLAMIQFGIAVGGPIGLLVGSYVAVHYGWRHAVGVVAVPGFLFALLALFIKDFKTQKKPTKKDVTGTKVVNISYFQTLWGFLKVPSLLCIFVGATFMLMFSGATTGWLPTYFIRHANMDPQVASGLAALKAIPGIAGFFVAGPIIDLFRRRFVNGTAIAMFLGMTVYVTGQVIALGFCTPGSTVQIALFLSVGVFGIIASVGGPTMIMELVPIRSRASAAGMLVACQNILGMACGPIIAGALSDMFSLSTAFLLLTSALGVAAICYLICIFNFKKDVAKVPCETAEF